MKITEINLGDNCWLNIWEDGNMDIGSPQGWAFLTKKAVSNLYDELLIEFKEDINDKPSIEEQTNHPS